MKKPHSTFTINMVLDALASTSSRHESSSRRKTSITLNEAQYAFLENARSGLSPTASLNEAISIVINKVMTDLGNHLSAFESATECLYYLFCEHGIPAIHINTVLEALKLPRIRHSALSNQRLFSDALSQTGWFDDNAKDVLSVFFGVTHDCFTAGRPPKYSRLYRSDTSHPLPDILNSVKCDMYVVAFNTEFDLIRIDNANSCRAYSLLYLRCTHTVDIHFKICTFSLLRYAPSSLILENAPRHFVCFQSAVDEYRFEQLAEDSLLSHADLRGARLAKMDSHH